MKNSILDDIFRSEQVTIVLKGMEGAESDEGHLVTTYMTIDGVFVESDGEFVYITPNLSLGITEAIRKTEILRIFMTDLYDSSIQNMPDKKEMN